MFSRKRIDSKKPCKLSMNTLLGLRIIVTFWKYYVSKLFTCWTRKSKPAKSINGPAMGQLVVEHDQSMLGKLKSPSIIMLGKREGKAIIDYISFGFQNNVIKFSDRTSGRSVH